ncbi:MAG: hypothetical protein Q9160_009204 [Pyrenula sp. 1 TL-2023]
MRFLKVSEPLEDDEEEDHRYDKVRPFADSFREACKRYYLPGSYLAVDEQLIVFHGRSRYLVSIRNKAAGKGYKVLIIGEDYYLIDLLFYSGADKLEPEHDPHIKIALFKQLQQEGFAALGTAKSGAGGAAEQLASASKLFKKHHHGYYSKETVEGIDSWLIVDNKPLFLLTTLDLCDEPDVPKPARKRRGISKQNVFIYDDEEMIPFKLILIRYNTYMGAANLNAQARRKELPQRKMHPGMREENTLRAHSTIYLSNIPEGR